MSLIYEKINKYTIPFIQSKLIEWGREAISPKETVEQMDTQEIQAILNPQKKGSSARNLPFVSGL